MKAAGLALAWAVAEATVWPIMPDALMAPLALRRPSQWWQLVLGAALGTILGGAISHRDGRLRPERRRTERLPLVRPPMVSAARRWLRENGPRGALRQAATGVPLKVFARTAGAEGLPLASFLAWAVVGRAARFGLLTGVAALLGRVFPEAVAQRYWLWTAVWAGGFGLALWRTVQFWERQPVE